MKIIVLGNGYIGSAFPYEKIDKKDFNVLKNTFEELTEKIKEYDVIINCIAITDTRWTEIEENFKDTVKVNSLFVGKLSDYCKKTNKKLIHISTGDIYGNTFEWEKNTENCLEYDLNTNYRFSKRFGEKLCNEEDLILRIRLPYDERVHPKNLVFKSFPYRKFYSFQNCYTYVPDLIMYIKDYLIPNNSRGVYNICQNETSSLLYLWRNIIKLPELQDYDIHNENDPNILFELNRLHIHNDINCSKIAQFKPQTNLESSWFLSYISMKKHIDNDDKL